MDIRAIDESERKFQLEVQVRSFPALPRRMLHNWSTCYLSRLKKGERYESLRPVISIWILEKDLYRDSRWLHDFTFRARDSGVALSEDDLIVTIKLSAWTASKQATGRALIEDPLESWLCFLTKGEEIDPEAAPAGLRGGEIEEALEIMRTFTKSEAAKDLYRRRMDYLSTQKSIEYDIQVTARDKGLAEGRAEGLTQGRAESAAERAHEDASRLKTLGVSEEIIVQATGLTRAEVEGL